MSGDDFFQPLSPSGDRFGNLPPMVAIVAKNSGAKSWDKTLIFAQRLRANVPCV